MGRYLVDYIAKDIEKKAILLSGPRQVGKTTLARAFGGANGIYLNYDIVEHRKELLARAWPKDASLVILDELHKLRTWKNFLKGVIDQYRNRPPLLVTGSARLETFRKAGDALTGRTFSYHLYPIDVAEAAAWNPSEPYESHVERLLSCGGFPESFFNPEDAQRLLRDRFTTVLRDDLRDLSRVQEIKTIELLVELLRDRVGGQVTYANLAKDLSVSPPTVRSWIELLEKLYLILLVRPYAGTLAKSIRKEPKCYFYDCSAALNGESARLENLVAVSLAKWCDLERDTKGRDVSLHYYRDLNKHEVDFVITEHRKALACIEVKVSDESPSRSLAYLAERERPKHAIQLVYRTDRRRDYGPIQIHPLARWLSAIEL